MMAAYVLRPLLLYLHLYAQFVTHKPALDDPHMELLPLALDWWPIATHLLAASLPIKHAAAHVLAASAAPRP